MFDEFTQKSENDILRDMQNDVDSSVYTNQGSFIYDVQKPTAYQIYNARADLNTILMYAFVQKSSGKYLDLAGEGRGVVRTLGQKSSGLVIFAGVPGIKIPIGVILESVSGKRFITSKEATIDVSGNVEVEIIAENIGSDYNVEANTINKIPSVISGVTSVTNGMPAEGGTDDEEDDDYRKRIIQRLSHPPSSGNKDDYIRWAEEVSGVKGVKVVSLWNGPGTVKVIVYGENGISVDDSVIQNVKSHIDPVDSELGGNGEGTAPIGAVVTIVTSTNKIVDVAIKGLVSSDIEEAKVSIEESLNEVFQSIQPGQALKLVHVIAAVAGANKVDDFSSIDLNGENSNVDSTDEEKIVLGSVTYE